MILRTALLLATGLLLAGTSHARGGEAADAAVAALREAGFAGDIGIQETDGMNRFFVGETPGETHGISRTRSPWPYASVSKQIVATMIMQAVEAGELALDKPASDYIAIPDSETTTVPTLRQLLQHRSGLPNPDDTALDARGRPQFYTFAGPEDRTAWCMEGRSAPPAEGWSYNNCDYIVLGAILSSLEDGEREGAFARRYQRMIAEPSRMIATVVLDHELSDLVFDADETDAEVLPAYGAAGAIAGNIGNIVVFDRALLDGRLLGEAALAEMWHGDPALGFMALGQWVFDAPLSGCEAPVRLVERRGAIGKYQARNYILPDSGHILVAMTNQSEDEFQFGEIWTGQGPAHAALSALACGETE